MTSAASNGVRPPWAVARPYFTRLLLGALVVHVMTAFDEVIGPAFTLEIASVGAGVGVGVGVGAGVGVGLGAGVGVGVGAGVVERTSWQPMSLPSVPAFL